MGTGPIQIGGFAQGIMEQSSTKKAILGQLRIMDDGRKFRYAKAGEALVAGNLGLMCDAVANHIKLTATAAAVGATEVSVTIGGTALTANQYDDGYLQVYDGTAGTVGLQYRIVSHTTSAAGTEAITIYLAEPLKIALTASDTVSLVPNPWSSVTEIASVAHGVAGVAPIAVTNAYYYWAQTGGVACVFNTDATALGSVAVTSATSGSFKTMAAYDSTVIGYTVGYAAVTAKYNPVFLTLD